ncbi:MAG: hypothetical protein AB1847_23075 [bacterium]
MKKHAYLLCISCLILMYGFMASPLSYAYYYGRGAGLGIYGSLGTYGLGSMYGLYGGLYGYGLYDGAYGMYGLYGLATWYGGGPGIYGLGFYGPYGIYGMYDGYGLLGWMPWLNPYYLASGANLSLPFMNFDLLSDPLLGMAILSHFVASR